MEQAFYARRVCKGLCLQLDTIGLCMGLCTTEPAYVQKTYDHAVKIFAEKGKPFTVIPYYAEQHWKSEALSQWLGKSVARHPNGQPQRFYVPSMQSSPELAPLTWCIDSADEVNQCPVVQHPGKSAGHHIVPVYVKAENPLTVSLNLDERLDAGWWVEHVGAENITGQGSKTVTEWLSNPNLIEHLKSNAYDSVCIKNKIGALWLVFDQGHFKSAIGNNGRYVQASTSLTDRPVKASHTPSLLLDNEKKPVQLYYGANTREANDLPLESAVWLTISPLKAYQAAVSLSAERGGSPVIYTVNLRSNSSVTVERESVLSAVLDDRRIESYKRNGVDALVAEGMSDVLALEPSKITVVGVLDALDFARDKVLLEPDVINGLEVAWGIMSSDVHALGSHQLEQELRHEYHEKHGEQLPQETISSIIKFVLESGVDTLPANAEEIYFKPKAPSELISVSIKEQVTQERIQPSPGR